MKKYLNTKFLLAIIILLASFLRLYNLNSIPISLNPDETAVGYNSYSILKTGLDEYGNIPYSLKSFGDWKLPGYPIIATIPIAIFGLNEFSVRLPSAVAGIVEIMLAYMISIVLFKKKSIGILTAALFAFNPWAIYFSRIAYEVNLATMFFMAGFLILIKYFEEKKYTKILPFSAIFLSLSIVTYHAYIIFVPIFIFFVAIFMRKNFKKDIWLVLSIIILGVTSLFYLYVVFTTLSKFSDVSLFKDSRVIETRINVFRTDNSSENPILLKAMHNKYTGVPYQIAQNYASSFSPAFLFDKGGEKFLHNIGTMGNFYLIDIIFLIFGLAGFIKSKDKRLIPLFIWLIIAPIPSALTKDAPSSTRLYIMLPALIFMLSYGAYEIFNLVKGWKWIGRLIVLGFSVFYLVSIAYYLEAYFIHMNYQRAIYLHYGFKQAVELANKYPDYKVIMFGPENFPYISFLFYNKYDPEKFRQNVKYYPDDYANFVFVKSFDRYNFVDTINYENLEPNTLYIDNRGIRDIDNKIIFPNGEPAFKYFFKDK